VRSPAFTFRGGFFSGGRRDVRDTETALIHAEAAASKIGNFCVETICSEPLKEIGSWSFEEFDLDGRENCRTDPAHKNSFGRSLTRRPANCTIACIGFLMLLLLASPALGQGSVSGSFNPNAFGSSGGGAKPPKKFLTKAAVATAGKLKISVASVAIGPPTPGERDRVLITFVVKNTDAKKRINISSMRTWATDENANSYGSNMIGNPNEVDPAEEVKFVSAVEIPAKKAKAIRLVLADGIGWEIKRSDWEKTP